MNKIMGLFLNIRMSVIPIPLSKMKYSDEIITKSISWAQDGKFYPWAGIIG